MLEPIKVKCGNLGYAIALRTHQKITDVYRLAISEKNKSIRTEKATPELRARALKQIRCR